MKKVPLAEMLKTSPTKVPEKYCIICSQPISVRDAIISKVSYCHSCQIKKATESYEKRKENRESVLGDRAQDMWMGFKGDRSKPQSMRVRKEEVFETENENNE